ncbi:hypothetical protein [Nonomuraea sp. GTA35]|uniref:hypothetical protein n=1 Tax=Nonomuraea sp. GTA35 TaxID=1676746 RepID=UPI0035BEEFB1
MRQEIYPVAAQSFQLYWSFLPEAADAMTQIGDFVRVVTACADGSQVPGRTGARAVLRP